MALLNHPRQLLVLQNADFGNLPVILHGIAAIDVKSNADVTFSGQITQALSNFGGLIKQGNGTLILSGSNFYSDQQRSK